MVPAARSSLYSGLPQYVRVLATAHIQAAVWHITRIVYQQMPFCLLMSEKSGSAILLYTISSHQEGFPSSAAQRKRGPKWSQLLSQAMALDYLNVGYPLSKDLVTIYL